MTEKVYIFAQTYDDRPTTDRVFAAGPYPWRVIDAALQGRIDALPADQVTELTGLRDFSYDFRVPRMAASLSYDSAGRLTTIAQTGKAIALTYDVSGRVATRSDSARTATYTYNSAGVLSAIAVA